MTKKNTDRSHYEIGKGKPPKKYEWKRGQSGNSRGRPKGAKNMMTIFAQELARRVQIQENGKTKKSTIKEVIVRRAINSAIKGDHKAIAMMIDLEPRINRASKEIKWITPEMSLKEAGEAYAEMLKMGHEDEDE